MLFAEGTNNSFNLKEEILCIETSPSTTEFIAVSKTKLYLYKHCVSSWNCVSKLAYTTGEATSATVVWHRSCKKFSILYSTTKTLNSLFCFSLLPAVNIQNEETVKRKRLTQLKFPEWFKVENSSEEEISSPDLFELAGLDFSHVLQSLDSEVTSFSSTRERIVLGTSGSAIIPILWNGEVVKEHEQILSSQNFSVIGLSVGCDNRFAGFVLSDSSCGLVELASTKRKRTNQPAPYIFPFRSASAICLHEAQRLGVVGFNSSERGCVKIFSYNLLQNDDKINIQAVLLKDVKLENLDLYSFDTSVKHLRWTSSESADSFCAAYEGLGIVSWSYSGSRCFSVLSKSERDVEQIYTSVVFDFGLNGYYCLVSTQGNYFVLNRV
eukprot:snap_masked-scaffold_27-processed-gene-1.31-mRNA-1 protein AED:1.00 eAED:1.00 QI:0/0/0/0/1/1/2/0/380